MGVVVVYGLCARWQEYTGLGEEGEEWGREEGGVGETLGDAPVA